MITALADTTVLSNFAHIDQPQLLQSAFDTLVAPRSVMGELGKGEQSGRVPTVSWSWLQIIDLEGPEIVRATELRLTLGAGESDCIAVALLRGWMVLTDDWEARSIATALGITVSGTLGALLNLIDKPLLTLSEADTLLREMKQHGYRTPVNSLAEICK